MRIDPDWIQKSRPDDREIALLAAEVRRLQNIIAGYTDGIPPDVESKPTLTNEEREAIEFFAAIDSSDPMLGGHAATLRKLLERLGGDNG